MSIASGCPVIHQQVVFLSLPWFFVPVGDLAVKDPAYSQSFAASVACVETVYSYSQLVTTAYY